MKMMDMGMMYDLLSHYTPQESNHSFKHGAKKRQRQVRKCSFPDCAVSKTEELRLKACGHCEVALYCSPAHQHLHRPAHIPLCKELTRLCDYQDCRKRARYTCANCKCIVYCSPEHETGDADAHRELCDKLSNEGRRFR